MPDINVGDVAVDVVPDARSFPRRLAEQVNPAAKKLGEAIGRRLSNDISDGIRKGIGEGFVGSDATAKRQGGKAGDSFGGSFARDAKSRIKAALASLPEAQIGVATSEADQKLKDLRARLAALGDKTVGVDIDDHDALAEMAYLEAELAALGAQSPNIQVQVDTARASSELAAFRLGTEAIANGPELPKIAGGFSGVSSSIGGAVSGGAALAAVLGVVLVALIPVVASATGLAAALVLPLAAAGGGLTLFGLLAGKAVSNTLKTAKAIDQLREKARTLQDPKAAKAAADQADALEKSLTRPQQAFLRAKDTLSSAFGKLLGGKTGAALFRPIIAGMNLLAKLLPVVQPIIIAVSNAVSTLLGDLDKAASGGGFKAFVQGFADLAGKTIVTAGRAIATFGRGLFNIFAQFLPLSKSVGAGIQGLANSFLAWTQRDSTKEGIAKFIDYVKVNGPIVAAFFGRLIETIIRLGIALAPIGSAIIRVGSALLGAFNKLPIAYLRNFFTSTLLGPLGQVLGAIGFVRDAIPGIGRAFDAVGKVFRGIYNAAIGPVFAMMLAAIAKVLHSAGSMLTILGKAPGFGWAKRLGEDLKTAASKADGLSSSVRKIPSKVNISVTSNIPALIDQANRMNDALKGKKGAKTHYSTGLGGGQTAYANGTNNARRGVALVGEDGPEMVRFRGGEKVIPARRTAAMMSPVGPAASPSSSYTSADIAAIVDEIRSLRFEMNGRVFAEVVGDAIQRRERQVAR